MTSVLGKNQPSRTPARTTEATAGSQTVASDGRGDTFQACVQLGLMKRTDAILFKKCSVEAESQCRYECCMALLLLRVDGLKISVGWGYRTGGCVRFYRPVSRQLGGCPSQKPDHLRNGLGKISPMKFNPSDIGVFPIVER